MIILEHRRSTRRRGIILIAGVVLMLLLFAVVYFLFFAHWVWQKDDGFLICFFIVGLFSVVGVGGGIWEIYLNGDFVCRLDEEALECSVPHKCYGESFRLPIAEIVKIEADGGSDTSAYYLWDKKNRRYRLSDAYFNPTHKFAAEIRKLNPAIIEVDA